MIDINKIENIDTNNVKSIISELLHMYDNLWDLFIELSLKFSDELTEKQTLCLSILNTVCKKDIDEWLQRKKKEGFTESEIKEKIVFDKLCKE